MLSTGSVTDEIRRVRAKLMFLEAVLGDDSSIMDLTTADDKGITSNWGMALVLEEINSDLGQIAKIAHGLQRARREEVRNG